MPLPILAWLAIRSFPIVDHARLINQGTIVQLVPLAIMASLLWLIAAVGADIRNVRPARLVALHAPPTLPAKLAELD